MKLFKVMATKFILAATAEEAIDLVVDIEDNIEYKALTQLDDTATNELIRFIKKLRENPNLSMEDFEHILKAYLAAKDVEYDEDIITTINNHIMEDAIIYDN